MDPNEECPEPLIVFAAASEETASAWDAGSQFLLAPADYPDVTHLITEDGTPVDNIYVERQYRLLTDPLYSSWSGPGEGRPFVALTN